MLKRLKFCRFKDKTIAYKCLYLFLFKLFRMKYLIFVFLVVINNALSAQKQDFFERANLFFSETVLDGKVNYQMINSTFSGLDPLIEEIKTTDISSMQALEQKAFLINAYNLLVIQKIAANYPIESPQALSGFFDSKTVVLGEKEYSLNDIENELIREVFNDSRVHFVLVCGAMGCPPITNFAYTQENVEEKLSGQTSLALNNSNFIRLNDEAKKVLISEIFKWYEADFKTDKKGILNYINQYRTVPIPDDYSFDYYTYNWAVNDTNTLEIGTEVFEESAQTFTPSKLLKRGQFDVQLFNNIYTQDAFRDNDAQKVALGNRSTYFGGLFTVLTGVTKSARLNVGLDINIKSVREDPDPSSSPFRILQFESNSFSRSAISSLGPKIKWSPFKKLSDFSIQSSFWIPISKGSESSPWLDYERYTSWTQIFFSHMQGAKFQFFYEVDVFARIKKFETQSHVLSTPATFILSYFPTKKTTIYGLIQYAPSYGTVPSINVNSYYAQGGLGAKYQITKKFNLELLVSNFFASRNAGAGVTYNLGIRYLHL